MEQEKENMCESTYPVVEVTDDLNSEHISTNKFTKAEKVIASNDTAKCMCYRNDNVL